MSTELKHIESHWNSTVIPSILEQYKDSEKWQECLNAVIDQMQIAEDAAIELTTVLDFKSEVPTGGRLDFIAGLVNVTRMAGESDSSLYTRFVVSLGYRRSGTPDFVINSAKLLSGAIAPQYMDEAPATFFVYTGPFRQILPGQPILTENGDEILTEGGEVIETESVAGEWVDGGIQLSHAQVRKLAPAGVLGLPGAALDVSDPEDESELLALDPEDEWGGKLLIFVADDSTIERDVLLADNLGNIVVTPQSVPVRVTLKGPSVPSIPTITTEWNGVPVYAVRIKDLPDGGGANSYMVRDSDSEGTVKSRAMDEATLDELWDSTPAEGEV